MPSERSPRRQTTIARAIHPSNLPLASASDYAWLDVWPDETRAGPSHRVLVETVPATSRAVLDPLEMTELHRELAALEPAEASIREFARRYGLLYPDWPGDWPSPDWWTVGGQRVNGCALGQWQAEIERMAVLVETWDAARSDDPLRLRPHLVRSSVHVRWAPQASPAASRVGRAPVSAYIGVTHGDIPADAALTVRQDVNNNVSNDLQRLVLLQLRQGPSADAGGFELVPQCVLGAAYLAFALELSAGPSSTAQCVVCGRPIVDARRNTRLFCDERCRSQSKRDRKRGRKQSSNQEVVPPAHA